MIRIYNDTDLDSIKYPTCNIVRYYTTDKRDGIIKRYGENLIWDELKNLVEGVLQYDCNKDSDSDFDSTDNLTNYYIVTGIRYNEPDEPLEPILKDYYRKEELSDLATKDSVKVIKETNEVNLCMLINQE